MDLKAKEKIIGKAGPDGLGLISFPGKHGVEVVLTLIDGCDLEVAADLLGTRVFYHHGQACEGARAGAWCSPSCTFTGQVQGDRVGAGPFHFSCTKFSPRDYVFSCNLYLAERVWAHF